ncbi:hypothetical protein Q664_02905 [Archangium violaceum Cb vi76]|uniref:Lanthionine biosynthesis cyclase LanC n=1 Tax=Archangium violaceum Cb vi76 TaxID=1406225 RepID=A0A084T191_9BACT|nr:hypothetical protein Q664_02905 [Archangium violaceum Cb vi76]
MLGHPDDWRQVALSHLDHACQGVADVSMSAGLFGGFPGVGWAVVHVGRMLDTEPDTTGEIDEVLLEVVLKRPWRGDFDLISGLVGIGVYALERMPEPVAERCLREVIGRLGELAQHDANGVAWHTSAARLVGRRQEAGPEGIYDLGMAHGLAGVIALLAGTHAAGVAREQASGLLEGAVSWLLAHSLGPGGHGGFPWAHAPGFEPHPARAAWCYGDAGIAAALQHAAACTHNPVWAEHARALALGVARRPRGETGVKDVGICHGSAGLIQILNRLYQATGEPALREAVHDWISWTLASRVHGHENSVAGFQALNYEGGQPVWLADRGLLGGAAGVALALLATVSDVAPRWDRVFLLS